MPVDKNALEAARAAISKAESSIRSMRTAKTYAEFQSAWSDFLLATSRVYTKLEQGAKTGVKTVAWFGQQKYQRRSDPNGAAKLSQPHDMCS